MKIAQGYVYRLALAHSSFERKFGKRAYCHLFVTHALEEFLTREWYLEGRTAVLHDRPPSQFRRTEMITQLNVRLPPYTRD